MLKRVFLAGLALVATTGLLTGCSGSKIESIDDLKDAYVKAGMKCDSATLSQTQESDSYSCETDVILEYFPTEEGKARQLEIVNSLGHSSRPVYIQTGENWMIFSYIERNLAPKLGGEMTVDDTI